MEQPKKKTTKSSEDHLSGNHTKEVRKGQKLARLIFFLIAGINILIATAMFLYSRIFSLENALEAIMRQSLSYVALVTFITGTVYVGLGLFLKIYPKFIIWTGIFVIVLKLAYSLYLNAYSFTMEPFLDVVFLIGLLYALRSYYHFQAPLKSKK
ncbi:hypothetical protein SAMN04487911_101175 [Arenibacter nanhaiticus]|uniref:DUF2127 domain-containing protein n=1 Tax=Arenibacter nanhaiticus TaxID=558155 RepID=A0A1M6ACV9_9FLAO|nr:hypothetical protein [Arenibacter nanhaiticus]SHI34251.1 hypothetical protein SAMN04487911_101175 [Arenibacter nanhaiticus]